MKTPILVTGANGQIGTELIPALRAKYGDDAVVASDVRLHRLDEQADPLFERVDVTSRGQINEIVGDHRIGTIYHMAALLSAVSEERPQSAWEINMGGLYNILEVARRQGCAVFVPSSIGAFGPTTPGDLTPQDTIQRPTSMYGVTKVAGEMLCDYYASRFGMDTRGLRLPGLISNVAPPGGGTTDYAVDIFYEAIRYHHYTCFLDAGTRIEMMYMPDAITAMIDLMEADAARLTHRNAFNVTAFNVTPAEMADAIRQHMPDFHIDYEVDPVRQAIANSWPRTIDDSAARDEWDWAPRYDLATMTADMLQVLGGRLGLRRALARL